MWRLSHRADPVGADLADRHYSRQTIGSPQFVPPGRCAVFTAQTPTGAAYWVTSWPFGEFVKHRWPGAWICSAFRSEGAGVASELIVEAVAGTRYEFGEPPELGMVTFVDPDKVRPTMVRGEPVFGWSFIMAGFVPDGFTKGGLHALRLYPQDMPAPEPAFRAERSLLDPA